MSHLGRLESKIAIVTGGAMGLGAGITRKFVAEGAKVLVMDINVQAARDVAASLPPGSIKVLEADVTTQEAWDHAVKLCLDEFGGLDVVVNNAGVVHRSGPSTSIPKSEYHRIMAINVTPLYHSAKAVQPHFLQQNRGVYVNISSTSATRPRPNLVWYAGSKGAVSAVTKGLAAEFAPSGIRVNCICPVIAETGMVADVLGGTDSAEGRAGIMTGIPMGRFALPEDIANAACFLASEEASFITGIELPVDGGRSLN